MCDKPKFEIDYLSMPSCPGFINETNDISNYLRPCCGGENPDSYVAGSKLTDHVKTDIATASETSDNI
jgi:hypothetical protein